jgi:hypothetical protein
VLLPSGRQTSAFPCTVNIGPGRSGSVDLDQAVAGRRARKTEVGSSFSPALLIPAYTRAGSVNARSRNALLMTP